MRRLGTRSRVYLSGETDICIFAVARLAVGGVLRLSIDVPYSRGEAACCSEADHEANREARLKLAHEGFGLVGRLAAQNGLEVSVPADGLWDHDFMYDAMLDEMFPARDVPARVTGGC